MFNTDLSRSSHGLSPKWSIPSLRTRNKMTGKALAAWQHIVETAGIQGGSNARHGFNVGPRRSVGASPVAVAQAASTAEPLSGPQPHRGPQGPDRNDLRAADRHPVARDAP